MLSATTDMPNSLASFSALPEVRFHMPATETPGRSRNALMCSRAMAPAPMIASRGGFRMPSGPREYAVARQISCCERDGTAALLVRRVTGAEHLDRRSPDLAAGIVIVCQQR